MPIRSERLDLLELSEEALERIIAEDAPGLASVLGVEVPEPWLAAVQAEENHKIIQADPAATPWLSRGIVLRSARRLVGEVGFHQPPDDLAVVELGYEVLPEYRRQGIAAEAIRALTGWAHSTGRADTVYVTIERRNEASIGLVRSLGFRFDEDYDDPVDGPIVFYESALPLPG
ncbi:MAG TPA: GNAT family N-acetyltransferase [Amycolatopsis sp.]|uniref:GNAT family N-acetyltransferase n=1 Tax=Amycolatopsis sp. TaxID=37632 RepID=UPI002B46A443|nr:GNAT family N-acetyltransferase [Amycolatopsis sp.]HKS49326.1 GNAT family N-acetyltransferase [Amycolatopsis sp.]